MTYPKLQKLLELSRRGEPGEADQARRILDQLLKKLNITEADIESPVVRKYKFRFKTSQERDILVQVICMVIGKSSVAHYPKRVGRKEFVLDLTASQAAEVSTFYEQYVRAWRQLLQDTLVAFVSTNRIYPPREGEAPAPTQEQLDEWARVSRIAKHLDVVPIRRGLPNG